MSDLSFTPSWNDRAACRTASPDLFYPKSMNNVDSWKARLVCRDCPVARECLQTALATNDAYGIRGGMSPHQRANLRKGKLPQKTRKPPPGARRLNTVKTSCDQGHEFTPENTRIYQGKRHCRTCMRDRKRVAYAARAVKECAA